MGLGRPLSVANCSMLIYRHHTCVDVIDLDDRTGRWIPVDRNGDRPAIVGHMSMAQRAWSRIGGSYAIENDRRLYFFWNEEGELVLRTDDLRLALFRRAPDGGLVELLPQWSVDLCAARSGDGREMPGMSAFTVSDGDGDTLVELRYDSARYMRYYLGNFTFVPDEDLRDWDFFAALESELVELRLLARARAAAEGMYAQGDGCGEAPVTLRTGQAAPRAGTWAAVHHLQWRLRLERGDLAPDIEGASDTWVWFPPWSPAR